MSIPFPPSIKLDDARAETHITSDARTDILSHSETESSKIKDEPMEPYHQEDQYAAAAYYYGGATADAAQPPPAFRRERSINVDEELTLVGPLEVHGSVKSGSSINFEGDFIVKGRVDAYGAINMNGSSTIEYDSHRNVPYVFIFPNCGQTAFTARTGAELKHTAILMSMATCTLGMELRPSSLTPGRATGRAPPRLGMLF
jgi:hypothetical protein